MDEIGEYYRSSSDESRQSDGGSDDDIESKGPESRCDREGEAGSGRVESEIEHASWMRLESTIAVRLTNPDRVTVEVMTTLSRRGPNLDVTVKEKPVLVG